MGSNVAYVVLNKEGKKEEYKTLIKDFLGSIYIHPPIPIGSDDFYIEIKDTYDDWGVEIKCYQKVLKKSHPHFTIKDAKPRTYEQHDLIFSFILVEMPGCCAYLISTNSYVGIKYRNKGIGQFMQTLKLKIAKDSGYPFLFATTVSDNTIENHILIKNGWIRTDEGTNSRTRNKIYTWKKEIEE